MVADCINGRQSLEGGAVMKSSGGKLRATLIQRFDGSAVLVGPKSERRIEFQMGTNLDDIHEKATKHGWVIGFRYLHGEEH